jgi:hypothetical protein
MTCDNEIPLPTLARNRRGIQPDNNRSVSEGVKCGVEVVNSWCRNILADHPFRALSPDHGEEVAGEVGGNGLAIRPSPRMRRARIASANAVDGL